MPIIQLIRNNLKIFIHLLVYLLKKYIYLEKIINKEMEKVAPILKRMRVNEIVRYPINRTTVIRSTIQILRQTGKSYETKKENDSLIVKRTA